MSGVAGAVDAHGGLGGLGGGVSGGTAGASNPGGAGFGGSAGAANLPDLPACEANEVARCTGTSPITCDFAGGAGDYLVRLELGGASASATYVEAEAHRRMLGTVELAAGETQRIAFGVNVRQPEGQPVQDVPAGTAGLQLYLGGDAPRLSSVCVEQLAAMPKVWLAGDSTVCDQSSTSYAGWGQHLPQHFAAPVVLANYADSGESSASVLASAKLWGAIKAGWRAGDWVLVQLGHNDKTVTANAFRDNMTAFVTQAKAAQVNIVLFTPISRAGSALETQHQSSAGADIPQIIKEVAQSQDVPVIDLTTITYHWLQTVDWTQYFALGTDRTHPSPAGAEVVAGLVRDAIRDQKLELAEYLR
jgi:lysophospholipase L1-like esterase